ncbi:hypothetical protein QQF64_032444 [Cirrhinus molitorella]|uniref:Uncharacterized protein n=1 Tax=Cirrhinus molitorella TaxID=172907 RepID=A0ABR3MZT6_9TELE
MPDGNDISGRLDEQTCDPFLGHDPPVENHWAGERTDPTAFRPQRVIFNIVNFSKTKSLYRDGMSPVVKSTSRPKWIFRYHLLEFSHCRCSLKEAFNAFSLSLPSPS